MTQHRNRERVLDLRCDRALEGLSPDDSAEMLALLEEDRSHNHDAFDYCAAALDLALSPPEESMPASVRARCAAALDAVTALEHASTSSDVLASIGPTRTSTSRSVNAPHPFLRGTRWLGALAACVAIATIAVWTTLVLKTRDDTSIRTPSELAMDLESRGVRPVALDHTDDPLATQASAEIFWDPATQRGCLRVQGLERNDPSKLQYQLWIFDTTRDQRFPVDGGVFDVADDGKALVSIQPPIPVRDASLFAVTVEPPGGSVVSDRRIVLVGKKG